MMLLNRPPRRFLPSQRLTNARADILPRDPGTRSELRIANRAAHTRIVSVARIRLDCWKSFRTLKGIFEADISEFESDHLSQAVPALRGNSGSRELAAARLRPVGAASILCRRRDRRHLPNLGQ